MCWACLPAACPVPSTHTLVQIHEAGLVTPEGHFKHGSQEGPSACWGHGERWPESGSSRQSASEWTQGREVRERPWSGLTTLVLPPGASRWLLGCPPLVTSSGLCSVEAARSPPLTDRCSAPHSHHPLGSRQMTSPSGSGAVPKGPDRMLST